jgi:DNA (cytosine-5)-methyltransferase 1
MRKAGYEVDYKIINTAKFGVPQRRKRVIIIGWNKESKLENYPEFKEVERNYLVKDFLCTLPKLNAGKQIKSCEYNEKSELLTKLGIFNPEVNVLEAHECRPNTERDLEIYRTAVMTLAKGSNLKYDELPEELKTHKNQKSFLDRFKVVDYNSPASQTVVAHISKDGHYYIHPDLKQNRSLSIREAARLQTFPDDFKFEGSRTSQFRQIGNAVPPMLSNIIASKIIKYI